MQLHVARLCLDCNNVHDAQSCPVCGSEAFAFLTKWVPAAERRRQVRPPSSPDAEVYRELITPRPASRRGSLLKTGALGVTIVAAASWLLHRKARRSSADRSDTP